MLTQQNPFALFRRECEEVLTSALGKAFPEATVTSLAFEKPAKPEHGQLASSLCFEKAKQMHQRPSEMADRLIKNIDKSQFSMIESVETAGAGYINFHVNFPRISTVTLESVNQLDKEYGFVKTKRPCKIIVEHTSVNPLHPIHIGQARNPIIGDTVARILKTRGHTVLRHYYIDDVGRQTSVMAYGYDKLGKPRPEGKADHFLGKIYTITSCIVEISRLKQELDQARTAKAENDASRISGELDEWASVAAELRSKHPIMFEELLKRIEEDEDPERSINQLNKAYEEGKPKERKLVREVSQLCFDGFKQTLNRIGVSYDSWDWESDFVLGGYVTQVLQKLQKTPFVFMRKGVLEFDAEKVIREFNLRTRLGLSKDHEVPSLTLARSDGTTLYTTRDIAYTVWKFERADKVINVIGVEQSLAQLQLKIALHAIGLDDFAGNLAHFAYNLVSLPNYKMSSRRGHYITLDEVMDEAVKRAYEEVSKRSSHLSEEEKQEVANFVGIGAVRYALVEVDTGKPVLFTWDRVLNFERNSAPYIQYTHARACSILRKAHKGTEKPAYDLLSDKLEKELILILADFPDTFTEAAECLKPYMIADYCNSLADKFNTFYDALPVLRAATSELRNARLSLVNAVRLTLRNALELIGVFAPEKM